MKLRGIRILVLALVSVVAFGCGGGGGGTATNQQDALPELKLTTAEVSAPALRNLAYGPYTGEDLKVLTFFGEAGTQTGTFVDANKGQLVFLETPDQQAVAVAYVQAADIAAGNTAISLDNIADGFIMINPLMLGYESADREALLNRAKSDPLYEELKSAIQNALDTEPQNLMNSSVFPEVYEYATRLILAAGAEIQTAQMARLAAATGPPSPVLGSDSGPYVGDFAGPDVAFVNPTMVFYGVDINNGSAFELIPGKEKAWGVLWWTHGPVVEKYALGDGQSYIRYSKGKYNGSTADHMAFVANIAKSVQLIVDVLVWCPISNDSIALSVKSGFGMEGGPDPIFSGFKDIFAATPDKLFEKIIKALGKENNWRQVKSFLYAAAGDKNAAGRFLENAHTVISAANKAIVALKIYDAATSTVPFAWDLITKPSEISLCGSQAGGLLTPNCRALIPPVANAKVFSPAEILVGDIVTFDASGSSDDYDNSDALAVRWDFDGDGVFDTNWVTSKQATHTYENVGTYTVFLQVSDSDGLVGGTILGVNVKPVGAQGLARHIKVFRDNLPWDSFAFEQVMSALGYPEGSGENQYEVLPSSAMATNILVPGRDFVIIMNDQTQGFYNNLAASYSRFERFLSNGGAMLWEACDQGWAGGSMGNAGLSFPGGITYITSFDDNNYVSAPNSVLMNGLPGVLSGTWASHVYFANLTADATVYLTARSGGATLFEYSPFGKGSVMITGSPLEFNYDFNQSMGLLYPRLFNYVLGNAGKTVGLMSLDPGKAIDAKTTKDLNRSSSSR